MTNPSRRTRPSPIPDTPERRQVPALLGLAPTAVALYSSPLASAASPAATALNAARFSDFIAAPRQGFAC